MKATINALAAMAEGIAVTITLPTERHGENRAVGSHITRLLQQAEIALEERINKRERRTIMNRLRKKIDSLDHNHLADGLWIGATNDAVYIHHLDDPVEPTVNVGDSLNLLPLARQSRRRGHGKSDPRRLRQAEGPARIAYREATRLLIEPADPPSTAG